MLLKNKKELFTEYGRIKKQLKERISEFERIGEEKNKERIFEEMVFCLLTPQSKAKYAWEAVVKMREDKSLYKGNLEEIKSHLRKIRFLKNKSKYILELRNRYFKEDIFNFIMKENNEKNLREWLVKNIKGYGYKEASHFLRNIGKGKSLSILDRHILKNLKNFAVIDEVPSSLSKRKYLEIEKQMILFSKEIKIPLEELDLLLWYRETGEVFK